MHLLKSRFVRIGLLAFLLILVFNTVKAQKTVFGTVRSAIDFQPMARVTVSVLNSNRATVTNENGEYEFRDVLSKDELVFTFVGFEKKIEIVGKRLEINISLKPTETSLDKIVVVGYGTNKQKNIVGSISQKEVGDASNRPTTGAARNMQGLIPGLNVKGSNGSQGADPGSPWDINIRGFTSINGGSPLVLVDGIEESLYNVNPNNIATITVLKDAESSAIYGARGAYGVLLIETKKAKAGKFQVEYTNNFGFSKTSQRTDFITDPYLYGKLVDAAIEARSSANAYTQWTTDEMWEKAKKVSEGELEPFMEKQNDGTYRFFYKTNWWDVLYRKWQESQTHHVSISGGSEKLNARLSMRNLNMTKIINMQDPRVRRTNVDLNLNFTPYKWLALSAAQRFNANSEERIGGNKDGYADDWTASTFRDKFAFYPAFVDGKPTDIGRSHNGYTGRVGALFEGANWRKYIHKNFVTHLAAKVTPIQNLELNFNYNYKWNNYSRPTREKPFEVLQGNRLKDIIEGQNSYSEYRDNTFYQTINAYGSYSWGLGNKNMHHFKLMLGFNREHSSFDHIYSEIRDLLSPLISNLAVGTTMFDMQGSTEDWGLLGYYGRFNYDYGEKYLVEVNSRYDASSRFPKGSKWGFFPSIGLGWRIDKENFWKNSSIMNVMSSLKIRGSYGRLGNQAVPTSTFVELIGLGRSNWLVNGEKTNYARIPTPLPTNISWEVVSSTNFGMDMGFMNRRMNVSFDWYQRETSNMYLPGEPLPAVFGAAEPRTNFASLRNRGFELELSYNNSFRIAGSPLTFNISANVSNSIGKITKFRNPELLLSTYYEGQILGTFWGYHVDGLFMSDDDAKKYENSFQDPTARAATDEVYHEYFKSKGEWGHLRAGDPKFVDLNNDGRIDNGANTLNDHGDLKKLGNAMPKFPFGFSINANWKNIDLTIIGQGIGHQDWYPLDQLYWGTFSRPYATFLRKDLYDHVWNPDLSGSENVAAGNIYPQIYRSYAAYDGGRRLNDFYLTNIGYLRLKNLTLGYTLPSNITKKAAIQRFRIFFSGEDILTIRFGNLSKYLDPEIVGQLIDYSDPAKAASQGDVDYFYYPKFKTFSFGVQIQF